MGLDLIADDGFLAEKGDGEGHGSDGGRMGGRNPRKTVISLATESGL